jgi:hypothetical protein
MFAVALLSIVVLTRKRSEEKAPALAFACFESVQSVQIRGRALSFTAY